MLIYFIQSVFAREPEPIPLDLQVQIFSQGRVQDLAEYVGLIYQYATGVAAIFATAMIMWGGMKWIFAGGDSGKITKARGTISNAVIGLILALGAFVILNTVNPALVQLKVPNISDIRRTALSTSWCPDDGDFTGRWNCGQIVNLDPRRDGRVGTCIGKHCPNAGQECIGAPNLSGSGNLAFSCLTPDACPSACSGIRQEEFSNAWTAYCLSDVCKAKIRGLCRIASGSCVNRIADGVSGCEKDADCQPGLWCNTGELPNTCRGGKLAAGISCDTDNNCESGICNEGYLRDQCAPSGGSAKGEPCDEDRDCGSAVGSDRVCNIAFANDSCVELRSLDKGTDCDRNEVCQSGKCEDLGADKDGDCSAP